MQISNNDNVLSFPPLLPLDNAAKIYPAAKGRRSPSMFRLSMELTEEINRKVLELALGRALKRMPSFCQHLKRGFFWYHLEHRQDIPPISDDIRNPCVYLNEKKNMGFQLRVSCYKKRISVDYFHVLTDGTGGMVFLKTLVAEYISIRYAIIIPRGNGILDCSEAPQKAEYEDSFFRYAKPMGISRLEKPAYHIKGKREEYGIINITTGIIPLDEIRAKATEYDATINEFLSAVLIQAIYCIQQKENVPFRRKQPVKVCIPINLRRHFPSSTLRNFTSYVNLGIVPTLGSYTLEEIITIIKHGMALEANKKMLTAKFSSNVKSEKNTFLKLAPLYLKDPIMKMYYIMNGDRYNSATLSNLGLVSLPDEMTKYIERVGFMLGAGLNPVSCGCVSFQNKLCFNISRTIKEPFVEKKFFTMLSGMGIHITLESNQR
ncbi:MAG: hypothetical protein CVU91_10725 [Firmicutes bacterium HGW-Firmicutes-16]|nr:MAG: hypothetical protein CVU91_10725 [Firmicutes bacterium HGW-Firmicutes-16]